MFTADLGEFRSFKTRCLSKFLTLPTSQSVRLHPVLSCIDKDISIVHGDAHKGPTFESNNALINRVNRDTRVQVQFTGIPSPSPSMSGEESYGLCYDVTLSP